MATTGDKTKKTVKPTKTYCVINGDFLEKAVTVQVMV